MSETLTFKCDECGFELRHPIARLAKSTLGLYDDERFPGRCILAYHAHEEHLHELPSAASALFMMDAKAAAFAILSVTGADRINYAILGNAEPHLHWHLVPRYRRYEFHPNRSPWNDPRKPTRLPEDKRERLMTDIAQSLDELRRELWEAILGQ